MGRNVHKLKWVKDEVDMNLKNILWLMLDAYSWGGGGGGGVE